MRAWSTGKLVTAVCHGPCALLGVDLGDGTPFVRGKKLTSFSKKEEYDYARDDVPYELEDALGRRAPSTRLQPTGNLTSLSMGASSPARTPPRRDRWRKSWSPP